MSVSLREIYGVNVVDTRGTELGVIDDVLFHPILPYAVGFSVKPPRVGGILKLKEKYLAFNSIRINEEGLVEVQGTRNKGDKAAWGEGAEKANAIDWELTIIYYGQDVVTKESRFLLGKLSDARFDIDTGLVTTVQVSDGMSADLMQGKRSFSGQLLRGFDLNNHALVVDEEARNIPLEGGVKEAAVETAERVVEGALKGAAAATVYAQKGLETALKSDTAKKTKSFFKKMAGDFKDAYDEEVKNSKGR